MVYSLTTAKIEEQAIKDHLKFGRQLPEKILNKPVLRQHLEIYYTGFLDLCSSRFGVKQPISYTAMMDYCQFWSFDDEQRELFVYFVPRLDMAYLLQMGE